MQAKQVSSKSPSEFVHLARENTRAAEIKALCRSIPFESRPTAKSVRTSLGDLGVLLDEPYRVGDGRIRSAGNMTAQDWKLRRVMLLAQADGLRRAVEVCDQAIEAIERAGVSTLREAVS